MLEPTYADGDDFFYQVGDQRTFSRNQALCLANGDHDRVHFYHQDHVWQQVDFSREPEQTFEQLCRLRCYQLRQQYSWLCVWLSGGYDSQTVLQSFIAAGIAVDEICYMDRRTYYADPELPFIENRAKHYQTYHNPRVRITPIHIDLDYLRGFYRDARSDWLIVGGPSRFTKSSAMVVHRHHDGLARRKDATAGSRADIYGKDKPRLNLRDGHWYVQSNDALWTDVISAPVTMFYTCADLPELHVKQCHMAARYFESLPELDHDLVHRIQSHHPDYYEGWNLGVGRCEVACVDARHGTNKQYFGFDIKSRDGERLVHYLSDSDQRFIDRWHDDMRSFCGQMPLKHALDYRILGREWPLRVLEKNLKALASPISITATPAGADVGNSIDA